MSLTACQKPGIYAAERAQVDSMQQALSAINQDVDGLDAPKIEAMQDTVLYVMGVTLKELRETQANRKEWLEKMAVLEIVARSFQKYTQEQEKWNTEREVLEHQLKTLDHSLRDEKLKADEVQTYLLEEKQAIQRLEFLVNRRVKPVEDALVLWDSIRPQYRDIQKQYDAEDTTQVEAPVLEREYD